MGKAKTAKFIATYLIAVFVGNILVYMVDRLGVKLGQVPMSLAKYIFVNSVVILIGIFIVLSTSSRKIKQ